MPEAFQDTYTAPRGAGHAQAWAKALDRILSESPADLVAASALCLEICRIERDSILGVEACRAYAALRRAQGDQASELLVRASMRELEAVRLALLESQRRPFGKLRTGGSLIRERKLLGLPASGPLSVKQINAAFRAVAQNAHPDDGGSDDRFITLTAARDALLRE